MLKVDFCTYLNFEPLRVNFAGWSDEGANFFVGDGGGGQKVSKVSKVWWPFGGGGDQKCQKNQNCPKYSALPLL